MEVTTEEGRAKVVHTATKVFEHVGNSVMNDLQAAKTTLLRKEEPFGMVLANHPIEVTGLMLSVITMLLDEGKIALIRKDGNNDGK